MIIDLAWVEYLFLSFLQPNYYIISLINHMEINDRIIYYRVNYKDRMVLV